jgi:hypothetical protein
LWKKRLSNLFPQATRLLGLLAVQSWPLERAKPRRDQPPLRREVASRPAESFSYLNEARYFWARYFFASTSSGRSVSAWLHSATSFS